MGFYGNMNNINKSAFQFDKIYSNKTEMDSNCSSDGVYVGRYVLIDYDSEMNTITGYKFVDVENNNKIIIYTGPSRTTPSINFEEKGEDEENTDSIYMGQLVLVIGEIHKKENTEEDEYECDLFEKENFELYIVDKDGNLSSDFQNIAKNVKYQTNYSIDKNTYKNIGRGWDSTVWQKTYKNGSLIYVMVAELNSVVPAFDVVADAPTPEPNTPYWDIESSNLYYKLHVQPSWGMRVKDAALNENSDVDRIVEIEPEEEGGEPTIQNIPQAIYWNQDGFDMNTRTHIDDASNSITVEPSGKSANASYDGNDIYEISILLPQIGNIMSDVWDIIYGTNRNTHIEWDDLAGASAYRPAGSFNVNALNNVAGVINSIHDLMGMIVEVKKPREKEESETNEAYETYYENWKNDLINQCIYKIDESTQEEIFDEECLNKIYNIEDKYYYILEVPNNEIVAGDGESENEGNEEPSNDIPAQPTTQYVFKELIGFAEDLNTIHGIILQFNRILGIEGSSDTNTIKGALHELQDILKKFSSLIEVEGLLANTKNDGIQATQLEGDNWIDIQFGEKKELEPETPNEGTEENSSSDEPMITGEGEEGGSGEIPSENNKKEWLLKVSHKNVTLDESNNTTSSNKNSTVSEASSQNGINKNQAIYDENNPSQIIGTTADQLKLSTIETDDAGHVTKKITETVTLPYGYKTINTLSADKTQDNLDIIGDSDSGGWIEIENNTINGKKVIVKHNTLFESEGSTTNNSNFGDNSGENPWDILTPKITYDIAGHIKNVDNYSYTLPNSFKTINVDTRRKDPETNEDIGALTSIEAENPIDALTIVPGDIITPVIANNKLSFNVSLDNIKKEIQEAVNLAVKATTIQSNFWGAQIPIINPPTFEFPYNSSGNKSGTLKSYLSWDSDKANHIVYGYGNPSSNYEITNSSEIIIRQSGTYRIQASVGFGTIAAPAQNMHIRIYKNDEYVCGVTEAFDNVKVDTGMLPTLGTSSKLLFLNDGDKLKLEIAVAYKNTSTSSKGYAYVQANNRTYLLLEKVENQLHDIILKFNKTMDDNTYNELISQSHFTNNSVIRWGNDEVDLSKLPDWKDNPIEINNENWYFLGWEKFEETDDDDTMTQEEAIITNNEIQEEYLSPIDDETPFTIDNDTLLVGNWSTKIEVSYQYGYGNEEELSDEIIQTLPIPPAENNILPGEEFALNNDIADVSVITNTSGIHGIWHFNGWYSESTFENKITTSQELNEDTIFYGKWIFTEAEHKVITYTYSYYSNLPYDVQTTLPSEQHAYYSAEYDGYVFELKQPDSPKYVNDGGHHTIWSFNGWNSESTIVSSNVEIIGSWNSEDEPAKTLSYDNNVALTSSSDRCTYMVSDVGLTNEQKENALISLNQFRNRSNPADDGETYFEIDNTEYFIGDTIWLPLYGNIKISVPGTTWVWKFDSWNSARIEVNSNTQTPILVEDSWRLVEDIKTFIKVTGSDNDNYLEDGKTYLILGLKTGVAFAFPSYNTLSQQEFVSGAAATNISQANDRIQLDGYNIDRILFKCEQDSNGRMKLKSCSLDNAYLYVDYYNQDFMNIDSSLPQSYNGWYYRDGFLWYFIPPWGQDTQNYSDGYRTNGSVDKLVLIFITSSNKFRLAHASDFNNVTSFDTSLKAILYKLDE